MHDPFSEIIAFPPMPVALDFEVWMRASGLLYNLEHTTDPISAAAYEDECHEKHESLVDRVEIDGQDYLELYPIGQIFHETFRERFHTARDHVLPPPVPSMQKRPPRLEKAGWPGEHPEVEKFMSRVTSELPQLRHCATFYYNPTCPNAPAFAWAAMGSRGFTPMAALR